MTKLNIQHSPSRRSRIPLIIRDHHSAMCFMGTQEMWSAVAEANRRWQNKTSRPSAVSSTAAR